VAFINMGEHAAELFGLMPLARSARWFHVLPYEENLTDDNS